MDRYRGRDRYRVPHIDKERTEKAQRRGQTDNQQVDRTQSLSNIGHDLSGFFFVCVLLHQTDMATPALARFGSDELKRNFLAPSISGEYVSCIGVSESSGGSDVASIRTTAKSDGDDLIINGGKMWITNGAQADWMCLLANTEASASNPHLSKSLICLPMKTPGVKVSVKGRFLSFCFFHLDSLVSSRPFYFSTDYYFPIFSFRFHFE